MRVGFVTVGDTGRLTGGYLYNARVLAGLQREEIEVEELVASGASPAEQEEAAPRLGSLVDPRRFDVIVVDALARIVCAHHLDRWREVCPVVAMVHELPSIALPDPTIARGNREPEKPLLRADRLIAVSDHGSSILRGRGVPAERIHVVAPGFDRLSSANADAAEPAARDGASVRALCVAQWIPRKGILDLVRAWTARARTGAMLELIGEADTDPAYAASVRAAIADAPDAPIAVSGPVDDAALGAAYAVADLFVLPSWYEGYGIAYAEALAHGLPVIACDVGPVPGLVGAEAATLVPAGDIRALSGALDLLLEDTALRSQMSAAARRRADHLPRWEDTVAAFRRVLEEASASRAALRPQGRIRS